MRVMALFQLHFLQNACVQVRVAPGEGHLCHIDTFQVLFCRDERVWIVYFIHICILNIQSLSIHQLTFFVLNLFASLVFIHHVCLNI